jgi:hypothetical protein
MLNSTWIHRIGRALLHAVSYLIAFWASYPIMFLFASASEPPLWKKVLWFILFPWATLLKPNYMSEVIICLLLNALTWGVISQLLIELSMSFKRL